MEWLNYWSWLLQVGQNCRCPMALSLVFLSGMALSQRASESRVRDPYGEFPFDCGKVKEWLE